MNIAGGKLGSHKSAPKERLKVFFNESLKLLLGLEIFGSDKL
jgi:hypothetical protein